MIYHWGQDKFTQRKGKRREFISQISRMLTEEVFICVHLRNL
jgi:hypothetical protein